MAILATQVVHAHRFRLGRLHGSPCAAAKPAPLTHLSAGANNRTPVVGWAQTSGGVDSLMQATRAQQRRWAQMASAGSSGRRAASAARETADSEWIDRTSPVGLAVPVWSKARQGPPW